MNESLEGLRAGTLDEAQERALMQNFQKWRLFIDPKDIEGTPEKKTMNVNLMAYKYGTDNGDAIFSGGLASREEKVPGFNPFNFKKKSKLSAKKPSSKRSKSISAHGGTRGNSKHGASKDKKTSLPDPARKPKRGEPTKNPQSPPPTKNPSLNPNLAYSSLKYEQSIKPKPLDLGIYLPAPQNPNPPLPDPQPPQSTPSDQKLVQKTRKFKSKILYDSSNQVIFDGGSSLMLGEQNYKSSSKKLRDVMDSIIWLNEESDDELTCPPEFIINQLMTEKFSLEKIEAMGQGELEAGWKDIEYILSFKYQFVAHLTSFEQILLLGKTVVVHDLCFDKPDLLQSILIVYFRTTEQFYATMTIDYSKFVGDLFEVLEFLGKKIEGIEDALIYAFGSVFKNCENYLYLFNEDALLVLVTNYFRYANKYLSQCIAFFVGDSDRLALEKFNTYEFSSVLDIIFRYSAQ